MPERYLGVSGPGPLVAEGSRVNEGDGQGGFLEIAELAVALLAAVVEKSLHARRIRVAKAALGVAVELGGRDGRPAVEEERPRRRPDSRVGVAGQAVGHAVGPVFIPGRGVDPKQTGGERRAGFCGEAFLHQRAGFIPAALPIARPGQKLFCVFVRRVKGQEIFKRERRLVNMPGIVGLGGLLSVNLLSHAAGFGVFGDQAPVERVKSRVELAGIKARIREAQGVVLVAGVLLGQAGEEFFCLDILPALETVPGER